MPKQPFGKGYEFKVLLAKRSNLNQSCHTSSRGAKQSNEAHVWTTDPHARLARKSSGHESKMGFTGHLLMENRNGLIMDARLTRATGTAEPKAALDMPGELPAAGDKTVGADKNHDTAAVVAAARELGVTSHRTSPPIAARTSTVGRRATKATG